MSIGSALQAGVSGLRSLSTKLAAISNNIQNSSTAGYKRLDTQFSSLVTSSGGGGSFSAGGISTTVRTQVSLQGTAIGTGVRTDLSIGGSGFFAVSTARENGEFALTRAGSFRPDETGALRNAGGLYLQGFALNPDGTPVNPNPSLTTFDSLETVNIGAITGTATPTSEVRFVSNIPQNSPGPFETGVQYIDQFGAAQDLTFNWVNTGPNTWDLEIYDGPVGGVLVGTQTGIDFDAAGGTPGLPNYAGAAAVPGAGGITALGAGGVFDITLASGQVISVDIGDENAVGGITQFAGDYDPETFSDGAPLGELQAIEINREGVLIAVFNTGERRPVYQIPLAEVTNPDGLTAVTGNAFELSAQSGDLRLGGALAGGRGAVNANSLEASNVDISEELTSLIETQRAYSSNATVVRTADEMLEEVTRLKR